jgi:hypothetical protein
LSAQKIFGILKDETWHSIAELSEQTNIETSKLIEYSQFLNGNGVAKYDEQNKKIKIETEWTHLIPDENALSEPRTTMANLIIPSKTSVVVQSTRISNLTQIELEVLLRINNRIKEIAINL